MEKKWENERETLMKGTTKWTASSSGRWGNSTNAEMSFSSCPLWPQDDSSRAKWRLSTDCLRAVEWKSARNPSWILKKNLFLLHISNECECVWASAWAGLIRVQIFTHVLYVRIHKVMDLQRHLSISVFVHSQCMSEFAHVTTLTLLVFMQVSIHLQATCTVCWVNSLSLPLWAMSPPWRVSTERYLELKVRGVHYYPVSIKK